MEAAAILMAAASVVLPLSVLVWSIVRKGAQADDRLAEMTRRYAASFDDEGAPERFPGSVVYLQMRAAQAEERRAATAGCKRCFDPDECMSLGTCIADGVDKLNAQQRGL